MSLWFRVQGLELMAWANRVGHRQRLNAPVSQQRPKELWEQESQHQAKRSRAPSSPVSLPAAPSGPRFVRVLHLSAGHETIVLQGLGSLPALSRE